MLMDDHHHHHHDHDHDHQQHHHHHSYGLTDLRQLVTGPPIRSSPHFPNSIPQQPTAELFPGHRSLPPPLSTTTAAANHHQHFEMMMFGCDMMMVPRGLHDFVSTDSGTGTGTGAGVATVAVGKTSNVSTPTPVSGGGFLEGEAGGGCTGGEASTGRWPRQETLTLLEIRSQLDPKFKEANQKGPLWEQVSRIMCEEHGYQRSGKKCREKFENLYKYYKKTKEGKAGRQDGKHYRFFRQLEALYGENNNNINNNNNMSSSSAPTIETNNNIFGGTNLLYVPNYQPSPRHHHNKHNCDSISLTTNSTTGFDTSSSLPSSEDSDDDGNDDDESTEKKRKRSKRSWRAKIKGFIDSQMRKLVEKQEEWLEKLVKTMEQKEKERVLREEEWRKEEATRLEREHKFWAKERAWIEARDVALMDALQKLTRREIIKGPHDHEEGVINIVGGEIQNQDQTQNNEDGSEILNSNVVVRGVDCWPESEFTRLQQLRAEVENTRFPQREVLFTHPKADVL